MKNEKKKKKTHFKYILSPVTESKEYSFSNKSSAINKVNERRKLRRSERLAKLTVCIVILFDRNGSIKMIHELNWYHIVAIIRRCWTTTKGGSGCCFFRWKGKLEELGRESLIEPRCTRGFLGREKSKIRQVYGQQWYAVNKRRVIER